MSPGSAALEDDELLDELLLDEPWLLDDELLVDEALLELLEEDDPLDDERLDELPELLPARLDAVEDPVAPGFETLEALDEGAKPVAELPELCIPADPGGAAPGDPELPQPRATATDTPAASRTRASRWSRGANIRGGCIGRSACRKTLRHARSVHRMRRGFQQRCRAPGTRSSKKESGAMVWPGGR